MATRITPTDGQVAQVKNLVEAALRKSGLDKDEVQIVITRGNKLQGQLVPIFRQLGDRVNPFKRVPSSYGYPAVYQPKPASTHLEVYQQLYPGLDSSHVLENATQWNDCPPADAELLHVEPKRSSAARLHGINDPYGKGAGRCIEVVLGHLANTYRTRGHGFYNYREGELTERYVRLYQHTREAVERLEAETPGDYNVFPFQSGKLFAGASVEYSRWEIEIGQQFGADPWSVGHHLLVHTERLSTGKELWIDCPGTEYGPDADGEFGDALHFSVGGGELGFGGGWGGHASGHWGSASGFLRE